MDRESIRITLSQIFGEVLNAPGITATDELTAADVPGWDSVTHIDMICAVEDKLGITFNTGDIARLANVGQLIDVIASKLPN
jgi:acyl carrier protein